MGPMRRSIRAVLLLNVLALVPNCQNKKDGADKAEAAPAASSSQPVGKVAQAVANAVEAGGPAAAASSGPPPDGILDPARAEAEAPTGSAPKLSLGTNGSEPRVALRSPNAALPRNLKLEVTLQAGMGQGLPPIEIGLSLDSKPSAAPSAQAGGKPDAKALSVTARVRDVKVVMPNVPEDFRKQIAELKGGKVTFLMAPDGGGYGFSSELPPSAKPELRDLLDTVTEGLNLLTMPLPTEPVGSGAFWIVVSREKSTGFGLVSYHMVKLTRADAKAPELEFDTRRYAIGRAIDPALLPPGSEQANLKEMSAGVKGRVRLAMDSKLPVSLEADAALQGAIEQSPGSPPRAVQSMSGYRISVVR